jgi:hypothetical protein
MPSTTHKLNNEHKYHPTECERCGRKLPKRHHDHWCATCIKQAHDFKNMLTEEVERSEFLNQVLVEAGAKEIA